MDGSIQKLRSTVRRLAHGKHPHAIRYPAPVRQAVVTFARTRLRRGQSLARIARGVGVSFPTLATWLRGPVTPALRPVTLAPTAAAPTPRSPIVLVTSDGVRVEGLDGETLVTILRALR